MVWAFYSVYENRQKKNDRDVYTDVLVFDWTTVNSATGCGSANRITCDYCLACVLGEPGQYRYPIFGSANIAYPDIYSHLVPHLSLILRLSLPNATRLKLL